jgi:hypothetical protein
MAGNRYAQPIDPSRTAALQPGQIWVPTPSGKVAMTLEQARQYQSTHPSSITDPNNPNLAPWVRQGIQDPRVQAAIQQGGTATVQVGDTKFHVENGQVTGYTKGGIWKPILLGAAVVGGAVAAPYLIPALTGGGGAGGAAALGPSSAASLANTAAIAGGSTVPASLAALTPAELAAAGGGAAAGGAGAAAALGPSTPASMAATQAVVGGSTVPASLSSAGVPAGVTGGVGSTLKSWLTNPSVLTAGIGTAGSLIGAGIQSSGISKAAEIEAAVQREALQYEKQRDQYLQGLESQRYGELNQRLQPYISTGQNASDRMAQILGLPAPSPYTPSQPIPSTPAIPPGYDQRGPGTPGGVPTGVAVPRGGTTPNPVPAQLVMMRAPDGSQQHVPADQVSHYQQLGAQVIG